MFRIRRIYDDILPINQEVLRQVKEIMRTQFDSIPEEEMESIGEKLRNPFKQQFRSILFAAESLRRKVLGFALLLHEPRLEFCFLDWIATTGARMGGGLGGALYEQVRMEAFVLGVRGLFFECLPDDFENCPQESLVKENRARLRFYERYGARPMINTDYESPVNPGETCMPHLVLDGLDRPEQPGREFTRKAVRALLERKYAEYCPPGYVNRVVASIRDDPVQLRPFRYVKPEAVKTGIESRSTEQIALIVNNQHNLHHVHERGYVESPVRVESILTELEKSGLFIKLNPRSFPDKHLYAVHDRDFVTYLQKASIETQENKSLYPYVFPIRNKTRPPKERSVLSGYYCIDTFTPINRNIYPAARRGVDCTLTAAREILDGRRISYSLIRPPGHHAERRVFGGFCYFNNNAIAAQYLCTHGKVAILDIDYHHGNGQQDIFYRRSDVLTVSIHGHPSFAYPYFAGFADEQGEGEGEGFNLNLPLAETLSGDQYRKTLERGIKRIEDFDPQFLVIAFGLDTAKGDPTGTWNLLPKDFFENGRLIGTLGLPTLVVQEGGYRTRTLGQNALRFLDGLANASAQWIEKRHGSKPPIHGMTLGYEVKERDVERIRKLVEITGFFSAEEINIATELVSDRLTKGVESGYFFVLAEHYGRLIGYTCYGPISGTTSAFDLYWIAVHPDYQGKGLGQKLLRESEHLIKQAGGTRIYVDTSQRVQYASTRAFYESRGYRMESILPDFYSPGDGKVIYCKVLV